MADIKPKAEDNQKEDLTPDWPRCPPKSPLTIGRTRATGVSTVSERGLPSERESTSLPGEFVNGTSSHSARKSQAQVSEEPRGNSTGTGPNSATDTPRVSPRISKGLQSAKNCAQSQAREGFFFAKTKPPPATVSKEASASEAASDSENSGCESSRLKTPQHRSHNKSDGHRQTGKRKSSGRSQWDFGSESSESSSEDCDGDFTWEPHNEFVLSLLSSAKRAELASASHSRRKRKLNVDRGGDGGSVPSAKQPTASHDCADNNDMPVNKEPNVSKKPDAKSPVPAAHVEHGDSAVESKEHFSDSKCREEKDTECAKVNHKSEEPTADPKGEPLFYPCTKCNVNFKEKNHLHRHMLQHQAPPNMNIPRPFICRECGRSFRDGTTLQKHMVIHQVRRERLMEEIKGLSELHDEGRQARLQCPQCVFGTECAKTFVQHAKTHEKDKRYYCCESCNHMATSPQELELHRSKAHPLAVRSDADSARDAKLPRGRKDVKLCVPSRITLLYCKICLFSTQNKNILKKHTELIHRQPYLEENDDKSEGDGGKNEEEWEAKQRKLGSDMNRFQSSAKGKILRLPQLRPKLVSESSRPAKGDKKEAFWSDGIADLCVRNNRVSPNAQKGLSLPLLNWSFGTSTSKLSSSLLRLDKPSKLSLPPTARNDLTASLLRGKEGNRECPESRLGDGGKTEPEAESKAHPEAKVDGDRKEFLLNHKSERECGSSSDIPKLGQSLSQPVPFRTLSKRKMSIPYHNTFKPKPEPISPALSEEDYDDNDDYDDDDDDDDDDYDDDESFDLADFSATLLESSDSKQIPYMPSKPLYLPPRSRLPMQGDFLHSNGSEDEESDCEDIRDLVIKEECEETALNLDAMSAHTMHESLSEDREGSPTFGGDQKSCPYCPAMFESGVGLSNHVRGHLHRVGLTYDARHMVTAEQVASKDRQLRIRRKPPSAIARRLKKAVDKPESQAEHTCPLCWGWFDTRTGLSNHVRGHLKRIGRGLGPSTPGSPGGSSSRSPLCILNELLRDESEQRTLLALLGRRPSHSRPFVAQKFASSDGLFLTPAGVPVKVQHKVRDEGAAAELKSQQWSKGETLVEGRRKERKTEVLRETIKVEDQGILDRAPSYTLAELLRRRKQEREQVMRLQSQAARRQLPVSPARETGGRLAALKPDPGWSPDKSDAKKVCVHCNQTFHSAVSLSNHLRAYDRRKRAALLEGTTYECKLKKPRSRPGPKKKMFSLPHSPEEIYRLTCRFCDLVFQGPLSVQEDWIKHLQRHLMHTSVPHTGAAMVEVTAVCKELPPPPPPERLVLPSQQPPLQVPPTVS